MKLALTSLVLALCLIMVGCGCDGESPSVVLVNHGTAKADIQIKTSGGNTENVNNVMPETSSETRRFFAGVIEFTVNIQGVDAPVVYALTADDCYEYVVTINADNTVSSRGTAVD